MGLDMSLFGSLSSQRDQDQPRCRQLTGINQSKREREREEKNWGKRKETNEGRCVMKKLSKNLRTVIGCENEKCTRMIAIGIGIERKSWQ